MKKKERKNMHFISESTKDRPQKTATKNKNTFYSNCTNDVVILCCWCWWWNFAKCIIIFIKKATTKKLIHVGMLAHHSKPICVFLRLHSFKPTNGLLFYTISLSLSLTRSNMIFELWNCAILNEMCSFFRFSLALLLFKMHDAIKSNSLRSEYYTCTQPD